MKDLGKMKKLLNDLKPYVIVVGSFAKGTNKANSDIDLYVKRRPQKELDEDWYNEIQEHYIDKVIEVFESNGLGWDSLFVGYVHTNDLSVQVEASSLFRIHKDEELKIIDVFGVEMLSAIDNEELDYDKTLQNY